MRRTLALLFVLLCSCAGTIRDPATGETYRLTGSRRAVIVSDFLNPMVGATEDEVVNAFLLRGDICNEPEARGRRSWRKCRYSFGDPGEPPSSKVLMRFEVGLLSDWKVL